MSETEFSEILQQEKESRERDIKRMEETEGWSNLTDKQQRMIKASLYIQQRAERTTDPASAELVVSPQEYVTNATMILPGEELNERKRSGYSIYLPSDRKYDKSQDFITNWYCHAAVDSLENEKNINTSSPDKESLDDKFFEGQYEGVEEYEELKNIVKEQGFPCVLNITTNPDRLDSKKIHTHSLVVLGTDSHNDLIIWDKRGYMLPYRVTELSKVYDQFSDSQYYWGVRELRKTREDSKE